MKKMYLILTSVLLAVLLSACGEVREQEQEHKAVYSDFSKEFNGINGCAVFYDLSTDIYTYYNKDMCDKEYSPFSTFKIVATLSALENNIVSSPDAKMKYNGDTYPFDSWNSDLTLKEAFEYSCVWYYRQLIDKTGKENIQNTVNELNYGNKDISQWEGSGLNEKADLNGFWLGSSLKISPINQVSMLKYIFDGNNDFKEKNISILKDIMLSNLKADNENIKIFGKTGTGKNNEAWFTGFTEQCGFKNYFAIYLDNGDGKKISSTDAKEIALNIINNYFTE